MIRETMDALAACRAWPGSVEAIAGCRRQAFEAGATVGSMPTRLKMHPDVAHLAFLLGAWRGMGTGGYPTVQPFAYEEVLTFSHVAKPYLIMQQRTFIVSGDGRTPSHMEFAFWRPAGERAVEVVSTHPNGVVEIETGNYRGRPHLARVDVARPNADSKGHHTTGTRDLRYERRDGVRRPHGGDGSAAPAPPAREASPIEMAYRLKAYPQRESAPDD
jgi:hypothetical protein